MMRFDDFVAALQAAGWRDTCDAQHSGIKLLWERMHPALADSAMPDGLPTKPAAKLTKQWLFIDRLMASDPLAWRTALEQEEEALYGHVLDEASFQALLDGITRKPGHVTAAWLESLAPYLTPEQMRGLSITVARHNRSVT